MWCFTIINGKLGEIYFRKNKNGQIKFLGHCYVKRKEFKTEQEQRCIDKDIKKTRIVYRGGRYKLIPPEQIEKDGGADLSRLARRNRAKTDRK